MKLFVRIVVAVLAMAVAGGGSAAAGGWAVTSLDSVPSPRAGEPVEVGFVIRQHGATPVNPEGDVGIVVRSATGDEVFFAAEPSGDVGHYVVEVTFADPGTSTWAVRQGWFAEQDLGSINVVGAAGDGAAGGGGYRWPGWIRLGLPILAAAMGSLAFADAVSSRRRRTAA